MPLLVAVVRLYVDQQSCFPGCVACSTMEQAFSDLSNLMGKAADMVELAERFRSHMNRRDGAGDFGELVNISGSLLGVAIAFSI